MARLQRWEKKRKAREGEAGEVQEARRGKAWEARRGRGRGHTGIGSLESLRECIPFGTLTRALAPRIWVVVQAFSFTLNGAEAALREPALIGKAPGSW
jgi:hypothetical protein